MNRGKHYSLAALCGLLATATLPPINLFFLLIPSFSGLFYLLWKSEGKLQAFTTGWLFGLFYFSSGLYWFANALLVEADKFAWMIPFAVFGLPSVLAIYYGLCCYCLHILKYRFNISALLGTVVFSILWLITEYLRGHLFTGFPWNLIAYSWSVSGEMSQFVYIIGSYCYSGWTVLLASLPAVMLLSDNNRQQIIALSTTLAMTVIPFSYGFWRLSNSPTEYTEQTLHIVQGNIEQQHKWDPAKQYQIVQDYVKLTNSPNLPEDTVVIWPETSFPYFLEEKTPPVRFIANILPKNGMLLVGAMRAEWNDGRKGIKNFYNSLHVVMPDSSVSGAYDKVKLVPFGEFVPFRGILPVEKITHGLQDFKRGAGAVTMKIDGLPPFQPLICYEAVFPQFIVQGGYKPEWLLNLTNDAWFGHSTGPYQHLQMTRFRAIEQGLPMVRAANTGISAVFDAYGRELAHLDLGVRGALTVKLPKPAND